MKLNHIHHVAIICSDYEAAKKFYIEILGLTLESEHYREHNNSYKADLYLNGIYVVELFSFPDSPERVSYPEALGLRHLAFAVSDIDEAICELEAKNVKHEEVRIDGYTGKRFVFFHDPDGLPIEFYEE